jgi:hypothetical protein
LSRYLATGFALALCVAALTAAGGRAAEPEPIVIQAEPAEPPAPEPVWVDPEQVPAPPAPIDEPAEPFDPSEPEDAELRRTVETLVAQLDDEDFAKREKVTRVLSGLGKRAVRYAAPYAKSRDPEIAMRVKRALEGMKAAAFPKDFYARLRPGDWVTYKMEPDQEGPGVRFKSSTLKYSVDTRDGDKVVLSEQRLPDGNAAPATSAGLSLSLSGGALSVAAGLMRMSSEALEVLDETAETLHLDGREYACRRVAARTDENLTVTFWLSPDAPILGLAQIERRSGRSCIVWRLCGSGYDAE